MGGPESGLRPQAMRTTGAKGPVIYSRFPLVTAFTAPRTFLLLYGRKREGEQSGAFCGAPLLACSMIVCWEKMTVILTKMIKKAVLNGETFAYGSRDIHWDEDENAAKRPGLIISLIPLLVLIIIFNIFSVNIFMATMIGWILALILFWKYIDGRKEVMEICVEGGKDAFGPISSVGSLVGFTSVVQLLPGFQTLLDSIFTIDVSPVIILILAISLVAGLTGSSTSAVRIGIPLIAERCTAAGLSLSFIHRVSCFACTTIDTLPWLNRTSKNVQ